MDARQTRKEFLQSVTGLMLLPAAAAAAPKPPRVLIVVAHPDDEYAFAATIYRITRELGGVADQVVVTNGEGGYRYSTLAEAIYGVSLTRESDGRAHLPAIRKAESHRAGQILGIRHQHFLDQKDSGFADVAAAADTRNWNRPFVLSALDRVLRETPYDFVFTLLPSAETHGHHRMATALALEAVALLPEGRRPVVLGADPGQKSETPQAFADHQPALAVDRTRSFGYHDALNYQIVVNWVIAEHKSQGLFQTDCGRHDVERFWSLTSPDERTCRLAASLR